MRYYSCQRPVGPGTYPKMAGSVGVFNFDEPTYCAEIGCDAWGYLDYPEPLDADKVRQYELTPARPGSSLGSLRGWQEEGRPVLALEQDWTYFEFGLSIMGTRRSYQRFSTLQELRVAVSELFSPGDQGIANYLTTFPAVDRWKKVNEEISEERRSWRHIETSASQIRMRVVWADAKRNVTVEVREYKGRKFYVVHKGDLYEWAKFYDLAAAISCAELLC